MCETIFISDHNLYFTISLKNKELTISSDDCTKNFNFLNLETDKFYSPIELLALVADVFNTLDADNFQTKDVKKLDDISSIFEDAFAFLQILDLIVVNKCPCGIFANTYKRLSFMLYEHITNTGVLSYLKPKWWRNWDIDHKEYYQNYMDVYLTQRELH